MSNGHRAWLMGQTKLKIESFLLSDSTLFLFLEGDFAWFSHSCAFIPWIDDVVSEGVWCILLRSVAEMCVPARCSREPTTHAFGRGNMCLPSRHARQTHRHVRVNRFQYVKTNWKIEIRARSPPNIFIQPFLTHTPATHHRLPSTTTFSPPTHTEI